jgi:O-antigen ligase
MFPSFIVTLIIFHSINEREDLEKVFLAYVIGCLIIAGISMYAYYAGYNIIDDDEGRVTALNQDQNELSFLLSFGIISIIYLLKYLRLKKATKVLLFMLAALFAFVILTTGSRMGLILLIMIVGTLILMNIKSASVFYIIPLICVLGIAFFALIPDTTAERLIQINDQISNRDLTGRVTIWKLGLIAFESKKAYLLGTGYYTFQSLVGAKSGQYMASHNTYLSTLIELGTVGFLIFLSLIIYLIYRAWYLIRNCSFFFILLILPLLATMFVLTTNNRRWLFLIGVIIIKLWYFAREEINISLSQQNKGNISKT